MVIASCISSGCQTWQKSHEAAISSFRSGDVELAQTSLQESQQALRSEKKILELDQAILDLANGNIREAEGRFRNLRYELEHLGQKDVTEQASSILSDSRAVAFSGRDFERQMVLNMALLSSVFGDGQDSFAYSLQVTEAAEQRRTAIAKKATTDHSSSALAEDSTAGRSSLQATPAAFHATSGNPSIPAASAADETFALSSYLSAAVQSETPSRYEETDHALSEISYWNPRFQKRDKEVSQGDFGTRCQPGHGTLHIIAMVGRSPKWVSESAEPTSAALLIADRIISMTGKHTLPPTIASVKIAKPEPCGGVLPAGGLSCSVAGSNGTESAPRPLIFSSIVDLNAVAMASYHEHRDQEIASAIARRVIKKGAVYVLKETQNIHRNSLVDLGINVAGIAWEAMEKADTRSWRMLPARIDIARTELPVGEWTTSLQINQYGSSRTRKSVPIHIVDGRNTFVLCIIPENEFVGKILVGGADQASVPAN